MEEDECSDYINGYKVNFNDLTKEEIKIVDLSIPCKGYNIGKSCPEYIRTKQKC